MLNLNGSLTKAGVAYSTLWSEDFRDAYFRRTPAAVAADRTLFAPDRSCGAAAFARIGATSRRMGAALAQQLRTEKAILGVFDEGCMGMFNAIIPDDLLHATGVFKERLSQSALYYESTRVSEHEARAIHRWLVKAGMTFHTGPDDATDLTIGQILQQCRVYIAAVRLADDFGCAGIGIQYQQGLKDLLPASDLVEGILEQSQPAAG
jgi:hypothetical protein